MIAYTSDQTQICGLCRDDYLNLSYGSTHTESLSCIAKSLIQIDINLKNRIQTGKLVQGRGEPSIFCFIISGYRNPLMTRFTFLGLMDRFTEIRFYIFHVSICSQQHYGENQTTSNDLCFTSPPLVTF